MIDDHRDRISPPLTKEQDSGVLALLEVEGVEASRESLQVVVLVF